MKNQYQLDSELSQLPFEGTQGTLVYKCRNCNAAYEGLEVDSVTRALTTVVIEGTFVAARGFVTMTKIHDCDGKGRFGVADLIGGAVA